MPFYAEINESNVVTGVSQLSGAVSLPHMIEIGSYDLTLIGKLWDGNEFVAGPAKLKKIIFTHEFWARFASAEQEILIDHANVKVKTFLYQISLRSEINLTWNKLISAVNALESASIIDPGRAAEILEVS